MAPRTRDIAGYRSAQLIGQGGFSAVYQAADTDHGRDVAIKVLDGTLGEAERRRFDRERQTMGRLGAHPNIIPVYESGYTDTGEGYIVMQLATGGSLGSRLRERGPLPWPEAVEIMAAVAGATQAAHDHGVLHRDIKPDNILIDEYGNPKLSDFGIAAVANNTTATVSTTATLAHAAPEVLQGQAIGPGVDVYALGSTLFTLLTGLPPFVRPGDEGVAPMITRALAEPPPDLRLRGLPDAVARIVERALAKDPAQRQPTPATVAAELKAVAAQVGSSAGPTIAVALDQGPLPPPMPTPGGAAGRGTPTVDPGRPAATTFPTADPTLPPGAPGHPTGAGYPTGSATGAPSAGPGAQAGPGYATGAPGPGSWTGAGHSPDPAAGQPTTLFGAPTTLVQPTEIQPGYGPGGTGPVGGGGGRPVLPITPAPPPRRGGGRVWLALVGLMVVGALAVAGVYVATNRTTGTTTSTTAPTSGTTGATTASSATTPVSATPLTGPPTSGATASGATVSIDCPDQVALNTRTVCTITSAGGAVSGTWTLPGFLDGPQKLDTVPGTSSVYVTPTNATAVGHTFRITATITDASGATASVTHDFTVVSVLVRIDCPDAIKLNQAVTCQVVTANASEGEWKLPEFGGGKLTNVPGSSPISINPRAATAVGRSFTITATARDATGASATATRTFTVTAA